MYETKDSGERESFDSGMVRDTQRGKPRFDLLFPEGVPFREQMLTRFADLMERGADKYGERNWERGNSQVEYDRAVASAMRHLIQWVCGEDDEDHAAAVFFNIMQAETLKLKMAVPVNRKCDVDDMPDISGVNPEPVESFSSIPEMDGDFDNCCGAFLKEERTNCLRKTHTDRVHVGPGNGGGRVLWYE